MLMCVLDPSFIEDCCYCAVGMPWAAKFCVQFYQDMNDIKYRLTF